MESRATTKEHAKSVVVSAKKTSVGAASTNIASPSSEDTPQKLRPMKLPIRVAAVINCTDAIIVTTIGSLVTTALVVVSTCAFCGGHPGVPAVHLIDAILALTVIAAFTYLLSFCTPVALGVTLLLVQLMAGSTIGQCVLDYACVLTGVSPVQLGVFGPVLNILFTSLLCILPAIARPLYQAWCESSPLQNTLAATVLDTVVVNKRGQRLNFKQAFKRALLDSFGTLLYQWSIFRGNKDGDYDEWLSRVSGCLRIKRARKLSTEMLIARHKVTVRYQAFLQLEKSIARSEKKYTSRSLSKVDLRLKQGVALVSILQLVFYFLVSISCLRSFGMIVDFVLWSEQLPTLDSTLILVATQFGRVVCGVLNFAFSLFWPIVGLAGLFSSILLFRPTDIELSKKGVRFIGRHMLFVFQDPVLPWAKVKRIGLEVPKGKTSISDHWLVFYAQDGTRRRLRLGNIDTIAAREEILNAIERWAPTVPREVEVIRALQSPCDYSYTEIWLEALTAPPERERLEPLIEGALLKNGRYNVLQMLGSGGQGTAYLCEDCLTGGTIVLKEFMLPVFVDVNIRRKALATFEQEARLLKELDHPQVVKLVDYFVEDHRAYLVLEHISGRSLHQLVKDEGALDERTVRELTKQMCEILDYLSSREVPIVHRDFTPDNLILSNDGTLKLIDFNVAHQQSAEGTTGTIVGKTAYMAPEQFRGSPCVQSDIYSMGATLHFLLTAMEPIPISSSDPIGNGAVVSAEFNSLVNKLTQPDMRKRIVTIDEARRELDKCTIDDTVVMPM